VTQRALAAHRLDAAVGIGKGCDSHNSIELEQRNRRCWIIEIDLSRLDLLFESSRKRIRINLEANGQRGWSASSSAPKSLTSVEFRACMGPVPFEVQRI
jgi:hypothetical protein